MATRQFPKTQRWKIPSTDEKFLAGSFRVPKNQMPRYIRLSCINKNVTAGSFRVAIYSDRALNKLFAASHWRTVQSIEESLPLPFGEFWRGLWGFEFGSPYPMLEAGVTYHLAIESDGYTRNGSISYVGIALDSPFEINDNQGGRLGVAFEMYSYERVRI